MAAAPENQMATEPGIKRQQQPGSNGDGPAPEIHVEPVEVDLPQIRNRSSFEEHIQHLFER